MRVCPVGFRNLRWSAGFDMVERYRRSRNVCRKPLFTDAEQWFETVMGRVVGRAGGI